MSLYDKIEYYYINYFVVILLFVFVCYLLYIHLTGQTFGQQCSELFEIRTDEWYECMRKLSQGKK